MISMFCFQLPVALSVACVNISLISEKLKQVILEWVDFKRQRIFDVLRIESLDKQNLWRALVHIETHRNAWGGHTVWFDAD